MKKILLACAAVAALTTGASAATVGVSMAQFNDNFLTVLGTASTTTPRR